MKWGLLLFPVLTVVLLSMVGCRSTSYETYQPAMSIAPPTITYRAESPAPSLSSPSPSCGPGCRSCPGGSASSWSEPGRFTPASG